MPTRLPHDEDAESAVIGCCLVWPEGIRWASEWLVPSDFYLPRWATAFAAILELHKVGKRCDTVTVADQVKQLGHTNSIQADLISAMSNAPP